MERLTSNIDYCDTYCEKNKNRCPIYNSCINRKVYEIAKEYEDLEEQGKLLILPCKVGDTYFRILYGDIYENKFDCLSTICAMLEDGAFGKTVFFTQSEAEETLRKQNSVSVKL